LLVGVHHVVEGALLELVLHLMILVVTNDVFESSVQSDLVIIGFPLLDDHYFFHSIDHIKLHDILSEFTRLYLSVVKKVLYNESKHIGWRMLDLPTRSQLGHDSLMLFQKLRPIHILGLEVESQLGQLLVNFFFLDVLSNDGVQGVPHFMGNTGINHG
jgi:hypothetical protein